MIYRISLFILSAFFVSFLQAAQNTKPIVCDQDYVLCTSAPCIPDPRHDGFAICTCDVEKGNSVGYKSCEKRAPQVKQFKIKQLVSTFSFKQFKTKKGMTCARGKPWTDCVDAPCTLNPRNPDKAICSCKLKHDQTFVTFGGQCKTDTCSSGFWSGAQISSSTQLRNALLNALNITQNPWTDVTCPVADKH